MLEYLRRRSSGPTELVDIISEVRARWRLKLALRGVACVAGVALVLFLLAASGMEWARFSGASIVASRILLAVAVLASAYWFLVRPLRRRVTDEQVALYLEEHEPTLQAALISAVEASQSGRRPESEALVRRLVEQAVEACLKVDAARRVERLPLRRYAAATAGVVLGALLIVWVGPAFLRHAISAMLLVSEGVQAAAPYRIEVSPGHTSVPKGADQAVRASLLGFDSEDVVLLVRRSANSTFEEVPLVRAEDGSFEGLIFDINAPLEYQVVADRVQSSLFTVKVVDVPYVQRLEVEYRYPAYTGLEPETIEDAGDIAVLRGTEVRLRITPTMKTSGGRLTIDERTAIDLTAQEDGTLLASFRAERDGFYRVELQAPTGELVAGSPQYTIDVLDDRPPTVTFSRPGRDTSASAIEEVYVEANAEDDFGVRDLELVYSVNGGEEKVVKLFAGSRRMPEVTAGHTFYLEELDVEPGDSVSYYARAMDNDAVSGSKRAASDLYFLRVRPFKRDFRQAQSQGGGGGGGGGGGQVEALSEQQRQIISATFNINRDRRTMTAEKLRENSRVVGLSQSRLREQVEGLLTRMNSQLVERDPAFAKIAELLPQAVAAMKEAEARLSEASPEGALPPENRALRILQKAEEEYELQVSMGQQGGGGGGGGGAMQQELAEIFEQELDRMATRYETANQASQQSADREVDELLEKLKELARRQEQEAERQRRRALQGMQGSSGGSGAQQRALAEQVEEQARRLERLAREEQRPELLDAARQMREAADAMRRAAAGDANASAQAEAALERLRQTERRLQQSVTARAERDIQDARRLADEIARKQQDIADLVRNMAMTGPARAGQARTINERKNELDADLARLESQLDRGARESARDERAASRKMAEAAGAIRDNRLRDRVRFSQQLVSRGSNQQQITNAESEIASGIDQVRQRLAEAQAALGQGQPGNQREQQLDRMRRLARGVESLQEQTRERAQRGGQQGNARDGEPQDGQGQQGEPSRQGQEQAREGGGQQQGQRGQQGQQGGQRGEGGQQGDGGQGGDGQRADGRVGGFGDGIDNGGVWNGGGWGGWWDGRQVRLSPEDIRQLRNQARQYLNEARDLRGALRDVEGIDPRELDQILRALQQLEDDRIYQDVAELARLQSTVAEGLKRFEFALRRKVEGDSSTVVLAGTDEVPEASRKDVEQYFRSLARTPR